ncbi:MAG: PTS sugar transporter subunit IIA [Terrimicrobiaceae bacterium]|nr:PTS sugar transporter subunit IIA [Terrimicrobiaceae bacterium]
MIPISEILLPSHVNLAIAAGDQSGAVLEVLGQLRGDPRVLDWEALHAAVVERNAPALAAGGVGICIAHGRTNAVQSLVMAAGRSTAGIRSPQIGEKVRLVFVAGIPSALDAEYLRIVGAIARLCREARTLDQLLAAADAKTFVDLLAVGETRL